MTEATVKEPAPDDVSDPAVADLREVLDLGLAHGGEQLTAGESVVVRRILALQGEPASLYARLSGRKPEIFHVPKLAVRHVDNIPAALECLFALDLADGFVSWPERTQQMRLGELVAACRERGLSIRGKKGVLVERLSGQTSLVAGRWVRIRHKDLLARLARLAFLVPWPDTATLVLARLGVVRWPEYGLTSGAATFRDRRAMLAWEALLSVSSPDEAIEALSQGTALGGVGLDLRRHLISIVREAAAQMMRRGEEGSLERAIGWYRALADGGHVRAAKVAVRLARAVERGGDDAAALAILRAAIPSARPSEAVAIRRMGRRVARSLRVGFPPARPLAEPRVRTLTMVPVPALTSQRPRWLGPDGLALSVEDAVVARLASHGRRAIYGEGAPWFTLAALLCADLYFLPVPGALPVRFLSGPLDLGTPAFRVRRKEQVDALLDAISRGEASTLAARADDRYRGTRLLGARWDILDKATLTALADALGPAGVRLIVSALLDGGPARAAGMPDLAVLPGERLRLLDAWPGWLPEHLILAEIKGPNDSVRDTQRIWHDDLLKAGVCVEVWQVTP